MKKIIIIFSLMVLGMQIHAIDEGIEGPKRQKSPYLLPDKGIEGDRDVEISCPAGETRSQSCLDWKDEVVRRGLLVAVSCPCLVTTEKNVVLESLKSLNDCSIEFKERIDCPEGSYFYKKTLDKAVNEGRIPKNLEEDDLIELYNNKKTKSR